MASKSLLGDPKNALEVIKLFYVKFPDCYRIIWDFCMAHLPKTEHPDPLSHYDSTVKLQTPEYFSSSPDKETSVKDHANTAEPLHAPSTSHNSTSEENPGNFHVIPNDTEPAASNIGSDVDTDAESDVFVDAEPHISDLKIDTDTTIEPTTNTNNVQNDEPDVQNMDTDVSNVNNSNVDVPTRDDYGWDETLPSTPNDQNLTNRETTPPDTEEMDTIPAPSTPIEQPLTEPTVSTMDTAADTLAPTTDSVAVQIEHDDESTASDTTVIMKTNGDEENWDDNPIPAPNGDIDTNVKSVDYHLPTPTRFPGIGPQLNTRPSWKALTPPPPDQIPRFQTTPRLPKATISPLDLNTLLQRYPCSNNSHCVNINHHHQRPHDVYQQQQHQRNHIDSIYLTRRLGLSHQD